MSTDEIDKKIKELESKEHPDLSIINSLKSKKAMVKFDKIVRK